MNDDRATIERALLAAAHECDVLHVHEEGGPNHGERVEDYLRTVGLGPGNPWCAAFVTWCLRKAGYQQGPQQGAGAVRNWAKWAEDRGKLLSGGAFAKRGDLFLWLNANQTGHIGFVCETTKKAGLWWVRTLEGNSNENGSREGDRVVRKWRLATAKFRFVRLTD